MQFENRIQERKTTTMGGARLFHVGGRTRPDRVVASSRFRLRVLTPLPAEARRNRPHVGGASGDLEPRRSPAPRGAPRAIVPTPPPAADKFRRRASETPTRFIRRNDEFLISNSGSTFQNQNRLATNGCKNATHRPPQKSSTPSSSPPAMALIPGPRPSRCSQQDSPSFLCV